MKRRPVIRHRPELRQTKAGTWIGECADCGRFGPPCTTPEEAAEAFAATLVHAICRPLQGHPRYRPRER